MKFEKNVEKLETFRIEVEKLKVRRIMKNFFLITESIFYFYLFHFFV